MIGVDIPTEQWLVQQISEDPAILGFGDMDIKRAYWRAGQVGLLVEDPGDSNLYVVELQLGPTGDRHIIRLVERWAAVRKRHGRGRCFAVLAAEEINLRYLNILRLISQAVPVQVMEMRTAGNTSLQFIPVRL